MSTPSPQPVAIESWEQKEAQIRQERAEQFAKLPPEEQQKILEQEKIKFQQEQERLKKDLGYGDFDPESHQAKIKHGQEHEAAAKKTEIAEMEAKLRQPKPETEHQEVKEKTPNIELAKFLTLFDAAVENIKQQKPFEFMSVALDNFAQPIKQKAYMKKLFDHAQKADLPPAKIRERLTKGQTKPEQISLELEIDMGEDKNNHLGLTNLQLKVSLASLIDGQLTDKLARFTNLVLYAAVMHDRQKKATTQEKTTQRPAPTDREKELTKETEKFAITQVKDQGGLFGSDKDFEQGLSSPVAFSFNNGSVWGTFDSQGAPANLKELQESIDKTSKEK